MRARLAVYLGLIATAAVVFVAQHVILTTQEGAEGLVPAAKRAPAQAGALPPHGCLAPDTRLLQAVGDIHRLLTRTAFEPAVARFERGKWHITHRQVEVGAVPEYPDFEHMMRLLSAWAVRLGVRSVVARQAPQEDAALARQRLVEMQPALAASQCDRLAAAGSLGEGLLSLGARALVLLELQTTDGVGITDRVAARALALLAASQAVDSSAAAREACLLAHRMGYGAWAWSASERLPADDPIRLFVRQEDERLAAVASARGATREAQFLRLLRAAWTRDPERWSAWVRRAYPGDRATSLPVLGTRLAVGWFEGREPSAVAVFHAVARDLRLLEAAAGSDSATRVDPSLVSFVNRFEGLLEGMPARADGVFLDRDVLRAYYRGSFYTALWTMGEHYRVALSSIPATRDLATELAGITTGPGAEFGRWYGNLADAKQGHPSLPDLRKDLTRMPSFGAPLLLSTFEQIRDLSPYGGLQPRIAAVVLARRLDTRPAHRMAFGAIAARDLLMLPLAEDLIGSAASMAGPAEVETQGEWALLADDRAGIESLLARPDLTAAQRSHLLANLHVVSTADSASVCAAYREAIARHPESWLLVAGFCEYASRKLEAYGLARAAVESWLARNPRRNDMESLIAKVTLARTYEREGRWTEALRIAGPLAESQQLGAMARAAVALDRLGRGAEAETLAVAAWGRYPGSAEAQSLVAELFWRHGRYDDAAAALATERFRLSPEEWRWTLAPRFVACFTGRTAEALKAVDAILKAGLPGPSTVGELATGCGNQGRRDLAFAIFEHVPAQGQQAAAVLHHAYHQLKRGAGPAEALAWLRPRAEKLGAGELAVLTYEAFRNGEPELLWELGAVPAGVDGEFHWLMRAAAVLRWRDNDPEHDRQLAAYFAKPSTRPYRTLGRYLRGLEPDSTVRALAAARNGSACEAYYYLGLKAQAEGRYREAAEDYARCLATNQTQEGEYRWALAQLQEWQGRNRSLSKLAEADRRERESPLAAGVETAPAPAEK